MYVVLRRWLPLTFVTLAALWLRVHDLARRPMHADEANQAVKFGQLLETGQYAFDPRDHHGPTLYYATLPIAWFRGEKTLASVDETTLRLVPALAGTFAVLLLGLLAAPLGRWPSAVAAAFLAVSPPAVYYARDYIQETLLLAFTLAMLVCLRRWWKTASLLWAITAGGFAGLMLATKSSAPLFFAATLLAWISIEAERVPALRIGRDLAVAVVTALVVAALLYSSFGTHLAGVHDAISAYSYAAQRVGGGTSGHEKPWWYYLRFFGWQREGGLVWQQLAFSALAVCGMGLALRSVDQSTPGNTESADVCPQPRRFARRALLYTIVVAVALSAAPYKTPWHLIHWVPGLAILAASALTFFPRWWTAAILAVVVLWSQALQMKLAVFDRPADSRNPYAYVQSSPDVLKFRPMVDQALARNPTGIVRVISEEYWPLPWYFRGLPHVGYWSAPPADCDANVIIASDTQADVVRKQLRGRYTESFLGLRPGFFCVVFTRTP